MMDYNTLFRDIVAEIQEYRSHENLVIYGADLTANLVYEALKRSSRLTVDCFVVTRINKRPFFTADFDGIEVLKFEDVSLDEEKQVVVLCTHPTWYPEITELIRKRYKNIKIVELLNKEHIREKVEQINRKTKRTDPCYRKINIVVESQPRSGTTSLVHSLIKCCGGNFGTTFNYDYTPVRHQVYPDIFYRDWPGPLVIFSHFTKPASHHVAYKVPIVYPIRYIFDCYYSWGYLHYRHQKNRTGDFFLSADSDEWAIVKESIPLNIQWLEMIKERDYLRYEDWILDKEINVNKLKKILPDFDSGFFQVKPNKDRLYFSGDYRSKMDDEVYRYLKDNFEELIDFYWPEKRDDLY